MSVLRKKKNQFTSPYETIVQESLGIAPIHDSGIFEINSDFLLPSKNIDPRSKNSLVARLYKQFEQINRSTLRLFDLDVFQDFDGIQVCINIKTGVKVGALPLLSPITNKPDISLIIRPRFGWDGIGPVLSNIGWRILPSILSLPQLKISEKSIPPWVLSSLVLKRIELLLKSLDRQYSFEENDLSSPKGSIQWQSYATHKIPQAGFLKFPCRYPDLQGNVRLKEAIHYSLIKQIQSLSTQREHGFHVIQLIELCHKLLNLVKEYKPSKPADSFLLKADYGKLQSTIYKEGIQAIDWTVNEKGLAGLGDLRGIPWQMSMESLFEAYVESLASKFVKQFGGKLKTGRQRETITAIEWQPNFLGSQKYLLPDIVIERNDEHIIIDAKYKDHWEDLNVEGWYNLEKEIRERHRVDLFQILAYSSMIDKKKIKCCLIYPCRSETFVTLKSRNRLVHKAIISMNDRVIDLALTALPFSIDQKESIALLSNTILS